jgi:hypothetical protein
MKRLGVVAFAGLVIAAPLIFAGSASALPESWCDGAACVPGVPHDATTGASCIYATRWDWSRCWKISSRSASLGFGSDLFAANE